MAEAKLITIDEQRDANGITETVEKPRVSLQDISKTVTYISRGVQFNQPRLVQRAIRQHAIIRRFATKRLLFDAISSFVPLTCPTFDILRQSVEKIPCYVNNISATSDSLTIPPPEVLPEVEVYLFTTVITTLLRENLNNEAAYYVTILIDRIKTFNRRSLDFLSSRAFFYLSLAYEKIGRLDTIRPLLLALYRTSCVRHDEIGQAVLLNLLLRNFLHYNLIEQAQTLSLRTSFPENASNNQFCRYLYYMGRIQAVQLEYSEAYQRLLMASRKAPQGTAVGFAKEAQKLTVIVQLLMGDIPERSVFNHPDSRLALLPYLSLAQAVRAGDLQQFDSVVKRYERAFLVDKNMSLVQRLGHNVLKTGLRKISLSYSRISLTDVAVKLRLPSASSAEYVCAKAIRDGVIEAEIDHAAGWLVSKDVLDLYSTEEPQKAFHKRIAFCLDVYNDAIKGMRYPPNSYRKEKDVGNGKEPKEDEKSIEELIKEMEDDFDE